LYTFTITTRSLIWHNAFIPTAYSKKVDGRHILVHFKPSSGPCHKNT